MEKSVFQKLSERQIQCLVRVAQGQTSKEIAREVGLSPSTVDSHISAAIDRIGATNRAEAAKMVQIELSRVNVKNSASQVADTKEKIDEPTFLPALPPLGGKANTFGFGKRIFTILHIAFMSLFLFSAIVFSISALVYLFSRT